MGTQTGVACQCNKCTTPQWYDNGVCQGCLSAGDIQFSWIPQSHKGGVPSAPPIDILQLQPGATAQLIDSWTNLVLVRGLTPHLRSAVGPGAIRSPGWYVRRGVKCSVRFDEPPTDRRFAEKLNRASDWTNQTFIVRIVVTFEEFTVGQGLKKVRLPKFPGMREFHHARRLRNAIAHGNALTDSKLVNEESQLFRPGTAAGTSCSLAIDSVLEPLWARLVIYAAMSEHGAVSPPPDPAVVVAFDNTSITVQTFGGLQTFDLKDHESQSSHSVGDIISLNAMNTV